MVQVTLIACLLILTSMFKEVATWLAHDISVEIAGASMGAHSMGMDIPHLATVRDMLPNTFSVYSNTRHQACSIRKKADLIGFCRKQSSYLEWTTTDPPARSRILFIYPGTCMAREKSMKIERCRDAYIVEYIVSIYPTVAYCVQGVTSTIDTQPKSGFSYLAVDGIASGPTVKGEASYPATLWCNKQNNNMIAYERTHPLDKLGTILHSKERGVLRMVNQISWSPNNSSMPNINVQIRPR